MLSLDANIVHLVNVCQRNCLVGLLSLDIFFSIGANDLLLVDEHVYIILSRSHDKNGV